MATSQQYPFDLQLPDQPRTTDRELFDHLLIIHNAIKILADYATKVIVEQIDSSLVAGSGINLAYDAGAATITIRFEDGTYGDVEIDNDGTELNLTAATESFLLDRDNHTGTQDASTITGLATVATSGSHADLNTFQGGTSGERYHLTSAQHTEVTATRSSRGIDTTDDLIVDDATNGLVLKDTQGTPHYWRVTVDNVGALVVSDLGTTKP